MTGFCGFCDKTRDIDPYRTRFAAMLQDKLHGFYCPFYPGGGGVLDISLGGEVGRGPSYPDPV